MQFLNGNFRNATFSEQIGGSPMRFDLQTTSVYAFYYDNELQHASGTITSSLATTPIPAALPLLIDRDSSTPRYIVTERRGLEVSMLRMIAAAALFSVLSMGTSGAATITYSFVGVGPVTLNGVGLGDAYSITFIGDTAGIDGSNAPFYLNRN